MQYRISLAQIYHDHKRNNNKIYLLFYLKIANEMILHEIIKKTEKSKLDFESHHESIFKTQISLIQKLYLIIYKQLRKMPIIFFRKILFESDLFF